MKAELRAGASVEFVTPREMVQIMADHRRALARHSELNRPIPKTVENSIVLDAAGAGVVDLGYPSLGRTWNVRRVTAVYQNPIAALAAGTAALFRGNDSDSPYNFIQRFGSGQIPAAVTYSADQLVLMQEEHLFVRISAATVSVPIFCSAQVIDGPRTTVYEFDLPENGKRAATNQV